MKIFCIKSKVNETSVSDMCSITKLKEKIVVPEQMKQVKVLSAI
jgi:hypothetical protein